MHPTHGPNPNPAHGSSPTMLPAALATNLHALLSACVRLDGVAVAGWDARLATAARDSLLGLAGALARDGFVTHAYQAAAGGCMPARQALDRGMRLCHV
jgi:hypothetical protein